MSAGEPPEGHPSSWYAATARDIGELKSLRGAERADVCVIGAGFTGLAAALNLAERGMSVVVLEAERAGFGASGRNGGMIGSGQSRDVLELEKAFGVVRSQQLWQLARLGKLEIQARIAQHGIDCDLQKGQLVGVHSERYLGRSNEMAEVLASRYDYPECHALDEDGVRGMVATEDFLEGLYDAGAMTLHPLNFCLGLASAAREAGVRIYERTPVTRFSRTDPATVSTEEGSVSASFVVLACNGYLGSLEPRLADTMVPVNNFMIATEPLDEQRAAMLIGGRFGVNDTRPAVSYFRLTDDRRLLFGGGEGYRGEFPDDIADFVRPHLLKVFPQLDDLSIEYAWGGTVGVTMERLPHVGRLEPNVYFAHGYNGHGISIANLAGKLMAEAIDGQAKRFDMMATLPVTPFPDGTRQTYPGMVLGTLYNALKDRL